MRRSTRVSKPISTASPRRFIRHRQSSRRRPSLAIAICEDLSAQLEQDASDGSGFARASVPGEQALARGWNALLQETKLLPKAAVWGPFLYFGAFANGWLIGNGIHRKWIHMRTDLEDTIDLSNASLAYASKGDTNPFTSFSAPVAMPFDGWYVDVGTARKQRHTARRVWERLASMSTASRSSERQVRRYVRERRRELGELVDEVFVPLCHEPGVEAEVDWGEATVDDRAGCRGRCSCS